MNLFLWISLFIFGTMFGSFASVVIYRLKSGEKGILGGRSHCAKCNKVLKAIDLIPIISWAVNKAKCRNCKEKISSIYPLLELSMGSLFVLIGYFLVDPVLILNLDINEIIKLIFWLVIGFITVVYVFYDILFLEIHEGVLLTGILLAFSAISLQSFDIVNIIPSLQLSADITMASINYSIVFLALSLIGFYAIMLKSLNEIWDFLILIAIGFGLYFFDIYLTNGVSLTSFPAISALLGALGLFVFFFLQIVISKGAALGGGDLRIAILVGLLMGSSLTIPGAFVTYLAGSIIGIIILVRAKLKNKGKKLNTQIPFGPFLAIGFFTVILLQDKVLELLRLYLG